MSCLNEANTVGTCVTKAFTFLHQSMVRSSSPITAAQMGPERLPPVSALSWCRLLGEDTGTREWVCRDDRSLIYPRAHEHYRGGEVPPGYRTASTITTMAACTARPISCISTMRSRRPRPLPPSSFG